MNLSFNGSQSEAFSGYVHSQWSWVQQVERPLGLNACLLDLTALTWQALLTCTNLLVILVQTVHGEKGMMPVGQTRDLASVSIFYGQMNAINLGIYCPFKLSFYSIVSFLPIQAPILYYGP